MNDFSISPEELRRIREAGEAWMKEEEARRRQDLAKGRAECSPNRPGEADPPGNGASEKWYLLRPKERKLGPLTADELVRRQPTAGDRIRPESNREWVAWEDALSRYPALKAAQGSIPRPGRSDLGSETKPAPPARGTIWSGLPNLLGWVCVVVMVLGLIAAYCAWGGPSKTELENFRQTQQELHDRQQRHEESRQRHQLQDELNDVNRQISEVRDQINSARGKLQQLELEDRLDYSQKRAAALEKQQRGGR